MATKTHRERMRMALNHQEPDCVPIDIGGTTATCINVEAYQSLKEYLGLGGPDSGGSKTISRISRTAIPSEAVLRRLDIDCRGLNLGGPDNPVDQDVDYPDGSFVDQWGIHWKRGGGDRGYYHDIDSTLRQEEPTLEDLKNWKTPDPHDPGRLRGLREQAQKLHEQNEYAIILNLRVLLLDLMRMIRGSVPVMFDMMVNREFYDAMIDRLMDYYYPLSSAALDEVGEYVDVVTFADDLAFQDRLCMHPDVYRQSALKPAHRKLCDLIKSKSNAKIWFHCCGAAYDITGDLIDIGVDILNPVQVSAVGMDDTARLKRDFGQHLSFWGAVDTQHVLPFGTPTQVKAEVKRRIEDLAPGGGFVVAPVHHFQVDVPPENVVAMCEATREYGKY
jgi:uroporphyrinogen decarboxylase